MPLRTDAKDDPARRRPDRPGAHAFAYHPYSLYPPMKSPEFSTAEDSPGFHHIAVDQR
jgi:hypothetical protein